MTILQWNLRGYRKRYPDLQKLIEATSPACICLQETMLGNFLPKPPTGYSILKHPTNGDAVPGTGVATLIHNSLPFTKLNINTDFQAIAIRVGLPDLITVCNIYLSPQEDVSSQDIQSLIDQLPPPFILLGDVNAKHPLWGDTVTDARGRTLENVILNNNLSLLNTGESTHFHVQSGSSHAIDITLCSPELLLNYQWKTCDELYGSDHTPILVEKANDNNLPDRPVSYNVKRADWKLFQELTSINESNMDLPIDDLIMNFNDTIYTAADMSIPKTSPLTRAKRVPWWTPVCSQLNAERKRALRRYQRSKLQVDKIIYQRARAGAQYHKSQIKKASWREYISSINIDTPMTKVWNRIRKMNGKYPANHPPCIDTPQGIIADRRMVSQLLADHFSAVSSSENYTEDFNRIRTREERVHLNFDTAENEEYNDEIAMSELISALGSCDDSAPGEDMITYSMLKHMHQSCKQLLLNIFNRIWTLGVFPDKWRIAIVLAFLKLGKTPGMTTSYRPIALTSCVCKLSEKIANIRLVRTLENKSVLSEYQYGFRKNRSTIDALIRMESDILDTFSRGEHMVAVFFDIQKAYDTAWRYGILKELHTAGIRGPLAWFIQNFLKHRTFKTRIGAALSREVPQEQGVPQGSVLSCSLFLLAMNGVLANMPQNVKASLYVDDLVIYTSSNHIPSIERRLQSTIHRIERWANGCGFRFSPQKTVAVHFHRKRGLQTEPSLNLYGSRIFFQTSAKYLGLTFDQRLRWRQHIENLKIKCIKSLDILKCLSNTKWGSDRTLLLRLYRSLVRSKLDYASFIYWTASEHTLKKLDPVHNAAIRTCLGAFRSSPVVSLYAESGEPSLHYRREQLALQFYARTEQSPQSTTYAYLHERNQIHTRPDTETFAELITGIIEQIQAPPITVLPSQFLHDPVWQLPEFLCKSFNPPRKNDIPPCQMKALFQSHIEGNHLPTTHIFTDGSKTDQSVGCAVVAEGAVIARKLNKDASIFSAELIAISDAVNLCTHSATRDFTIFSDSKSAVQALEKFNTSHPIVCQILHLLLEARSQGKRITFCWVPGHSGVIGNENADKAANEKATSAGAPDICNIPYRDYFPKFRKEIERLWQIAWTGIQNNKLRELKDSVKPWPSSRQINRHHEVVLCRLRIGHTLLTHGHLMERRPPPFCTDCVVPLTVKHILAECPTHNNIRRRLFPDARQLGDHSQVLRSILSENANHKYELQPLIQYITDVGIYNRI